jgi:GDP-4-dehydro-6-deoxy-D-mannose reductase
MGPILITGAAGFAGSHLLDRIEPRADAVVAWRRPGEALPKAPTGTRATWVELDLLDRAAVQKAVEACRPSIVYHLAGIAHVGGSWDKSARTLEVNVLGTHYLLSALAAIEPRPRVLVTCSAHVYKDSDRAIAETDSVGPGSPYGLSKLAQEMTAAHAVDSFGLPALITRPFNHIGPRQDPSFFTAAVARQVARIELGLAEPVIPVGNLDGLRDLTDVRDTPVGNLDGLRDLTDVRDTVRAYEAIAERGTPGRPYNVCSGQAYRVGDILDRLLSLSRVKIEARRDPARFRPHDAPLVLGDRSRLTDELGWQPAIPLDRTLADLLDYWRDQVAQPGSPAA